MTTNSNLPPKRAFFFNFSGRNLPDYSRKDFDTMQVTDGVVMQTGFQLPFPDDGSVGIDLGGATVFSAFADAHVHFTQTGITLLGCRLEDATSISAILAMLRNEAASHEYVLGWNMQESKLREKRLPTRDELDQVSKSAFIWLARADLHSAVVNTRALEWARSIFPALAVKDGLIRGEEYNFLSYKLNSLLPRDFKRKGLELAAQECFKNGVATVHALEGSEESEVETVAAADYFAGSPLHGVIYHQSGNPALPLKRKWNRMGGCLLVDGSIGTRTAAMHEPYADAATSGSQYLKADDIERLLTTAANNRLQLALHAIGDQAIETVTACYTWAGEKFGRPALPHRIEHFILPSDKAIMAARDTSTMICIQPVFDHFWGGSTGLYAQRLGKQRAAGCNPFKTILDMGVSLACGSDSPVTPINPLLGIHALVNHTNPDERIDLNSALSLFISEPHKFSGETAQRGHLRPGKLADFVCLGEDPFMVPPSRIKDIRVSSLYISGSKVF
ncbi:MAG TPA: amidohydrolase [Candidatus Rifleibacterium sp.]|nr:amidohydrolase [Candidatus Rifleibacterium sp.]HPT46331.1 amidohydrolase [Candidatus Rifleibacterium sp.]